MKKLLDNSGAIEKRVLLVWVIMFVGLLVGGIGSYFIFSTSDNGEVMVNKYEEVADVPIELTNVIDRLYFIDYLGKDIKSRSDLSNQQVLELAWRMMRNEYDEFFLEDMQRYVSKYFDYKVKGEDLYLHFDLMSNGEVAFLKYDEEDKILRYNSDYPVGDLYRIDIVNIIDKVYKDGDRYKVEVYKAYGDFNGYFTTKYYGSLKDSQDGMNEILEVDFDEDMRQVTDEKEAISKIEKSKMTKVTYVFDKANDNYILSSYVMG